MSKKWYGSINNRLEEGRNYNQDKMIHEGDDITIYYYSDCHCKYVTKVADQKHIFVHDYQICADRSKAGEMGHQDWLYFKTRSEENKYLNSCHIKDLDGEEFQFNENIKEDEDDEWMFRYGHWNRVIRFTQKTIDEIIKRDGWCRLTAQNEKEQKLLDEGKEVVHYNRITEGISFGVRNYHYDWSF